MLLLHPGDRRGLHDSQESLEGHMRETYMHVAGIVATDPTLRKFDDGRQVMSFRVASTSRRYDSAAKEWVDGPTLWVKVSCWRELASNASECVRKRDRVVVWGRVRSEQWTSPDGAHRSDLALEAEALGHDLTFGVSAFERRRRAVSTRTLTADGVVDLSTGELTLPEVPAGLEETPDVLAVALGAAAAASSDEDHDEVPGDPGDLAEDAGQEVPVLASA
jgi:single-strand DNA-binding protein